MKCRPCGRRSRRAFDVPVDRLVPRRIGERLVDVRRKRHVSIRRASKGDLPATLSQRSLQAHRAQLLADTQAPRRPHERLPRSVAVHRLEKQHLGRATRLAPEPQPSRHDARVVHHDELAVEDVRKLPKRPVLDPSVRAAIDEQPRRIARFDGHLGDELGRKVVLEAGRVHPAGRVASRPWIPRLSSGQSSALQTPRQAGPSQR